MTGATNKEHEANFWDATDSELDLSVPIWSQDEELPASNRRATSERSAEPTRGNEPAQRHGAAEMQCVFLGPPKAGKTSFLAGLARACSFPPPTSKQPSVEVLPGNAKAGELVYEGSTRFREASVLEPTDQVSALQFNITVTHPGSLLRSARTDRATLTVQDGPGGALFGSLTERRTADLLLQRCEDALVAQVSRADSMVLCADAGGLVDDPVWDQLPDRLRQMCSSHPGGPATSPETWLQRLYAWTRGRMVRRAASWEQRLKAKRFLLVLTKGDAVINRFLEHCRHEEVPGAVDACPLRLAEAIDPVAQARSLLGERFLHQIRAALSPNARFAVAFTSAWGLGPQGISPHTLRHRRQGSRYSSRGLRNWRPFGIRESVLFMTTGEAHGSVQLVRERDLQFGAPASVVRRGDACAPYLRSTPSSR